MFPIQPGQSASSQQTKPADLKNDSVATNYSPFASSSVDAGQEESCLSKAYAYLSQFLASLVDFIKNLFTCNFGALFGSAPTAQPVQTSNAPTQTIIAKTEPVSVIQTITPQPLPVSPTQLAPSAPITSPTIAPIPVTTPPPVITPQRQAQPAAAPLSAPESSPKTRTTTAPAPDPTKPIIVNLVEHLIHGRFSAPTVCLVLVQQAGESKPAQYALFSIQEGAISKKEEVVKNLEKLQAQGSKFYFRFIGLRPNPDSFYFRKADYTLRDGVVSGDEQFFSKTPSLALFHLSKESIFDGDLRELGVPEEGLDRLSSLLTEAASLLPTTIKPHIPNIPPFPLGAVTGGSARPRDAKTQAFGQLFEDVTKTYLKNHPNSSSICAVITKPTDLFMAIEHFSFSMRDGVISNKESLVKNIENFRLDNGIIYFRFIKAGTSGLDQCYFDRSLKDGAIDRMDPSAHSFFKVENLSKERLLEGFKRVQPLAQPFNDFQTLLNSTFPASPTEPSSSPTTTPTATTTAATTTTTTATATATTTTTTAATTTASTPTTTETVTTPGFDPNHQLTLVFDEVIEKCLDGGDYVKGEAVLNRNGTYACTIELSPTKTADTKIFIPGGVFSFLLKEGTVLDREKVLAAAIESVAALKNFLIRFEFIEKSKTKQKYNQYCFCCMKMDGIVRRYTGEEAFIQKLSTLKSNQILKTLSAENKQKLLSQLN